MQRMQIKRPLSALASGAAAVFLSFTAPSCFAVIHQQVWTEAPLVNLPPITVSKRMLSHTTQMRQAHGNTAKAAEHQQVQKRPEFTRNNSAHQIVGGKESVVAQYQTRHVRRFADPPPGAHQNSVRYIEPPERLRRLPTSTVIETQRLPVHYELAHVYQLNSFNRVVVDNNINVTLRNAPIPRVAIMNQGNLSGRDFTGTYVKNGTLYIRDTTQPCCDRNRDTPIQVLIDANNIQMVALHDRSSIYAQNYRTHHLNVISHTSGQVLLHGTMDVSRIEQHGAGMISLDWVKGNNLEIFSDGPGLIRLAGNVDTLEVRAIRNGKVDAKYLRSFDTTVQVAHTAEVAVRPVNSLNGFANDRGYIYYYKTPSFISQRNYDSGNILQMQYWD